MWRSYSRGSKDILRLRQDMRSQERRQRLDGNKLDCATEACLEQLRQLSIEEVLHGEVTSVLRKSGTVFDSPSAVYVINTDEIERSGARTIPDLLRMVPGMFVAQVDEHTWIVNARGLGKRRFERGLQVLVMAAVFSAPRWVASSGIRWIICSKILNASK